MAKNDILSNEISLPILRARKTVLVKEIKALDEAINALETLEKMGIVNNVATQSDNIISNIANLSAYEGAIIILKEKNAPMKTADILKELQERGKKVEAENPYTSVFSTLNKASERADTKIKKMGNGFWGLVGWN